MREKINGNIGGVRDTLLEQLKSLYAYPVEGFLPRELMQILARFTAALNREIALYITRDGEVVDVSLGSDRDVELRDFRLRRNAQRLSCIRCVHTHPNGDGHLSDVDISALRSFRYDAMVAVGCKAGEPTFVQAAFLGENQTVLMDDPQRWYRLPDAAWLRQIDESDALVGRDAPASSAGPERAVLMGIESQDSLDELARLADTAGARVVGAFVQKRDKPDNALLIGRGRAEELCRQCQALEADLCIFDEELTGIQTRNLEDLLHVKVIDRTTLILDIFAQRASTSEGKLQVELAQLQYQSTRLLGEGLVLSRLAGGIGTRGPGESKLEMNRRRIRERMTELRRRLDVLEKQRVLRRRNRERNEVPVVALVGYTNAGKSTLLNRMTGADVYVQDQLFATLDAVSRRMETREHTPYLLVDTVGFIRKLPHALVSAFRSTLDEAALADILVIVNDGSSPDMLRQHDTVEQVLSDLGATEQPRIEVINKCDLGRAVPSIPGAIMLSAKSGDGLEDLQARIASELQKTFVPFTFTLGFDQYPLLAQVRQSGRILSETYTDTGVTVTAVLSSADRDRLKTRLGG